MNIDKTLKKNIGPDAVVKFFKANEGDWYLVANGGLGTTITKKVEKDNGVYLEKELGNGKFDLIREIYIQEIGEKGFFYFYKG